MVLILNLIQRLSNRQIHLPFSQNSISQSIDPVQDPIQAWICKVLFQVRIKKNTTTTGRNKFIIHFLQISHITLKLGSKKKFLINS